MMIDEVNEISDFGIYYEGDDKCYWLGLFTICQIISEEIKLLDGHGSPGYG